MAIGRTTQTKEETCASGRDSRKDSIGREGSSTPAPAPAPASTADALDVLGQGRERGGQESRRTERSGIVPRTAGPASCSKTLDVPALRGTGQTSKTGHG